MDAPFDPILPVSFNKDFNNLTITSEIQNESFYDLEDLNQSVILQDANSF